MDRLVCEASRRRPKAVMQVVWVYEYAIDFDGLFATVGSEQRRQLLRDMGVEHVFYSRSLEFADLICRDTEGYGIDIVLNSVTGAAQRAGLELVALGG